MDASNSSSSFPQQPQSVPPQNSAPLPQNSPSPVSYGGGSFASSPSPSAQSSMPRQVFPPIQAAQQSMPAQPNRPQHDEGAHDDPWSLHSPSDFSPLPQEGVTQGQSRIAPLHDDRDYPTPPTSFMPAMPALPITPVGSADASIPTQPVQPFPAYDVPSQGVEQPAPWMSAVPMSGSSSPFAQTSARTTPDPFDAFVQPKTPPVSSQTNFASQSQPAYTPDSFARASVQPSNPTSSSPLFSQPMENPFLTMNAQQSAQPQPATPSVQPAFTLQPPPTSPFAVPQMSQPVQTLPSIQPAAAQQPITPPTQPAPAEAAVSSGQPVSLFSQKPPAIDMQQASQANTQTVHQSILSEIEQEELFGRERLSTWQKVLIVGVAVLTLAIVAGAGIWVYMTITAPAVANAPVTGKDTDGDGLSDIEERNYGTNPNSKDTDGDGFTDGEEIRNGYSPLGK